MRKKFDLGWGGDPKLGYLGRVGRGSRSSAYPNSEDSDRVALRGFPVSLCSFPFVGYLSAAPLDLRCSGWSVGLLVVLALQSVVIGGLRLGEPLFAL